MSSAMSGESGRSSRPSVGQHVRPEPVIEKTFVENVAGFINEVVPQTYSNPSHYEGKETISWVRFDHCDINDLAQFRDKIEVNGNSPPLLLIVGYACGVQVWVIPVNGEAVEVLSWRQGAVRTLKVLPSPTTSSSAVDIYSLKRPIIALCDSAGPGPQFCSVTFISLKTGEQVKTIKFKHPIHDIHANKNVIVISFPEKLAVFDATTLEDTFTISTCYPCPGPSVNPVSLGDRWLAYADRRLVPLHQSCGGMVPEGSTSYKATVFHAAKSLTKGLKELGESVASNLMGQRQGSPAQQPPPTNLPTPGVVTILDTQTIGTGEVNLQSSGTSCGIVAHFTAHLAAPIVALEFDPTGMLLLTADKQGHNFHLFRLQPHPLTSAQSAIHHLYTLHRGDTTAKVIDISFSLDSRWVAVSTHRGTTHVFPITPYGGNIGVRTHTSSCVVNRLSRFHRSAGLDDTPSSGRNSPVLSASPNTSKSMFDLSPNLAYPNPRYPPYPTPTTVKPLVQLRQPLLQNLIGTISSGPSPSRSPPMSKTPRSPSGDDIIKVASVFGSPRGWLAGSPTVPRDKQRRIMDSLFIMAYHGNLLEYHLQPHAAAGIPQDKITEDSPIELEVHASAQWALIRESTSGEIRPPLDLSSPLLAPLSPTRPRSLSPAHSFDHDDPEERWMAQVEIHTHAGPHRRLWMGPQFSFKSIPGVGSSHGVGVQGSYEGTPISAPSSGRPPRSSPVNMPGAGGANVPVLIEAGSLTGSHDQSPRLMERYSGDSDSFDPEIMMNQLRHDLADAMMDTQLPGNQSDTGDDGGLSSHGTAAYESTLDMTDVMDISCDPPGPSSSRTWSSCTSPSVSRVSSRPSSHIEEEVQAVTTRLHQVAVTHSGSTRASPMIMRTPSLEDSRVLTSSTEELSTTLKSGFKMVDTEESAWIPIDRPRMKSVSRSPDFVQIDHPRPAVRSGRPSSSTKEMHCSQISDSRTSEAEEKIAGKDSRRFSKSNLEEGKGLHSETDVKSSLSELVDSGDSRTCSSPAKSEKEAKSSFRSSYKQHSPSPMSSDKGEEEISLSKEQEKDVREEDKSYNAWTRKSYERVVQREPLDFQEEESFPALVEFSPTIDTASTSIELKDFSSESRQVYKTRKPPSTTTSEDDLWLTTENKKDKKKKKKRYRQSSPENAPLSSDLASLDALPSQTTMVSSAEPSESSTTKLISERVNKSHVKEVTDSNPIEMDMDADYFHAAEEYHEPAIVEKSEIFEGQYHCDFFTEPQAEEFQEARESVNQNLEDFELKPDEEESQQQAMLRSLHDDNDLAKALEEAYSSDDNTPAQAKAKVRSQSHSRPSRTSEMFPFKEDTSDEEDEVRLRRRVVVSGTVSSTTSQPSAADEVSTDDRGETSGDDRAESSTDDRKTATSESDVGASPNPRASSSSKNKKKKKKKR
ncbi:BCAS3 microtubule associated cell migration factor-like isoform X2 [Palaemon carinicauda]|uniref:BCAS3 microtubule associated cell migration factor-like isoform X2 n=1 Tax=Palaemon carinicauda TaxID=392227 RepID=UPI0035B6487A